MSTVTFPVDPALLKIVLSEFLENVDTLAQDKESAERLCERATNLVRLVRSRNPDDPVEAAQDLVQATWADLIALTALSKAIADAQNSAEQHMFKVSGEKPS